jgi:Cys-tRNA(Pro)/Cys-tRNA(Cys) deacylase
MGKFKIHKTNAVRLLDKNQIKYGLIPYEVDESNLGAAHVAESLGENVKQLFKTLVLQGDRIGYFVCIIPGDKELDLKQIAKISENKKCDLIPMKELLGLTGYIRGACSPIGMKKPFPTFIDDSCLNYDFIYVSAGQRGLQVQINPEDLIKIINAKIYKIKTNKH